MAYLLALLVALLGWVLSAWALDLFGRTRDRPRPCDAIIVPGCAVLPDGRPSPHLARRVERAVELWQQRVAPRLVFTGGLGANPPTEARAAAAYARSLGLPHQAMVLEERSRSTEENARFAASLVEARRVLVVTDSYHAPRAILVFRRHFPEVEAAGVLAPGATRLRQALREVPALAWYALRRWI